MFGHRDMDLEHPVITNLKATGYPDRREPEEIVCPCCGAEAENFYKTRTGDVVGCDCCMSTIPYYELEEMQND